MKEILDIQKMITIVIPAYNEEKAIGTTIASIREGLQGSQYADAEILVVDDGSGDNTNAVAAEQGVTIIRHPHNIGYGRSLKDGILNAKYDTIVIIDADLTYPANMIPELVDKYSEGFDMVVGARTGTNYISSVIKGPLRQVLKYLVEYTTGRNIPDVNSGLRVFSKSTICSYLNHLCDTFSFTTSMTLAYMMTGRFVHYVPIEYHIRKGETKVRLFRDSLRTLQYIVQAIIYYNPLKLFILLSAICILLSFLGFLTAAVTGLTAPYLLGIGCLLVSLLIFCIGLLADLLRQILQK